MPNRIPTRSRQIVRDREAGLCARCGMKGTDWHHRRRRSVRDEHQHCPCNGIWLCRTCHGWAHDSPRAAISAGFIVPTTQDHPGAVPAATVAGERFQDCEGGYTFAAPPGA